MPNHAILTAEDHRTMRIGTERGNQFGDGVMCGMTVPDEFRRLQNTYPILFRLNAARDNFTALALFGFENGENLFLDGDRWDAPVVPLAIEIQPFLIGRSATDSDTRQVHVDLDSPRIVAEGGEAIFDESGQPTPYLQQISEKLGNLDQGYVRSDAFFTALRHYELLEPLAVELPLIDGSVNRLVGFHAIDEDRLRALEPSAVGALHTDGHLMPIFMALASLSNLDELLRRKNQRVARHG